MSVGENLRQAREAKGLSLEDIKNSTQIMTRQLQEMEHDDFSSFAAPIYAKGFIRLFARAVGLDPEPLVKEFSSQPMKPSPGGPAPRPVAPAPVAPEASSADSAPPEPVPAEPAPQAAAPAAAPAVDAEKEPDDGGDLFSLAARPRKATPLPGTVAPAEPAAAPESAAAAPPKAGAKVVASTPLEFEKRPALPPQPEKRVAALEPGVPAPVPPPSPRAELRPGERAEFVPPPAAKKLPEQQSAAFHSPSSSGRPVAPDPLPLDGPAFRFPEPRPLPRPEAPDAPRTVAQAAAAEGETSEPRPSAPVSVATPVPVAASPLQPRLRKSFGMVGDDEDIVARDAPAPRPASPAPAEDEDIVARNAPKKRREPRPDAPNAASLFLSNLAAAARKAFGKRGRVPLLAGAAAVVALCVAGGVYLAAGRDGGPGIAETAGETPDVATVEPPNADPATPPAPPEDIAPVFPPPASWAK